ncbi:hypothetical protein [Siminovitchia fortis]|uniref:hypothetical protein n=1 Tax=Siminovitchia fortis TaxID=254758 RepID=UPI0016432A6F|nr:hypothetical protein [Siminovitchia fortis]
MNNYHFFALMTGKLLGDGCITKQQGRKPRFQFMHKKDDMDWAWYCFEKLKDFIPLNPPVYKRVNDKRLREGFSEAFFVQSKTDELITFMESIWYKNRKKVLPVDFIEKYFNVEALVWWYQDDGHLKLDAGIPRKIVLSTDSFTIEENRFLIKLLERKFKLLFSLDGQNRLILYDQVQIIYFLQLVKPFIHPTMNHKLIYNMPLKQLPLRTTIYLSSNIVLIKPTREINEALHKLKQLDILNTEPHLLLQFYKENINWLRRKRILNSYQIKISEHNRFNLSVIRQSTGLSISQAAEWCFKQS